MLLDEYLLTYKDNSVVLNAQIAGKDLISTEFNLNNVADIKTEGELKFSKGGKTQVSPYAFISALNFVSVTPSMDILFRLLRRILSFWANIYLSLSAYHVWVFFFFFFVIHLT